MPDIVEDRYLTIPVNMVLKVQKILQDLKQYESNLE